MIQCPNMNDLMQPVNSALEDVKIPLTVTLIALYLKKGYRKSQIAKLCGVSRAAVTKYVNKHREDLIPLLDNDEHMALLAKTISIKAKRNLISVLDRKPSSKHLTAYNSISKDHDTVARLWSGQSTQNISIKVQDCSDLQDKSHKSVGLKPPEDPESHDS